MERLTTYYGQWVYWQTKDRFGNISVFPKHYIAVIATAKKDYSIRMLFLNALNIFRYFLFHSLKNLL